MGGLDFDRLDSSFTCSVSDPPPLSEHRDVALLGTSDELCAKLAAGLGWTPEFEAIVAEVQA